MQWDPISGRGVPYPVWLDIKKRFVSGAIAGASVCSTSLIALRGMRASPSMRRYQPPGIAISTLFCFSSMTFAKLWFSKLGSIRPFAG